MAAVLGGFITLSVAEALRHRGAWQVTLAAHAGTLTSVALPTLTPPGPHRTPDAHWGLHSPIMGLLLIPFFIYLSFLVFYFLLICPNGFFGKLHYASTHCPCPVDTAQLAEQYIARAFCLFSFLLKGDV